MQREMWNDHIGAGCRFRISVTACATAFGNISAPMMRTMSEGLFPSNPEFEGINYEGV